MTMLDPTQEVVVRSISIDSADPSSGLVEIAFFEKRDQTDVGGLMKTLVIGVNANKKINGLFRELLEVANDLVDEGLVALREPEETFVRRPRRTVDEDDA